MIKDKNNLYDFLRKIGDRYVKYDEFSEAYKPYEQSVGLGTEDLLKLLYRLGILFNVNLNSRRKEYFSIIRNEKSSFNKEMSIYLHPGFNKGLHVYNG